MRLNRKLAAVAAAGALALVGPAAFADTFYNDLETPITVDTALESMNLTYDTANSVGTTGTATIAIQVDGKNYDGTLDDHPGCNIGNGDGNDPHMVSLAATSTDDAVATVDLSNNGDFNTCTDTVTATVTSHSVGTAVIHFAIDAQNTASDPNMTFRTEQADFQVNVTEGGGTPPVGCDADPAAPAWAAAILQKSGVKANTKDWNNAVASVAHIMTNGALYHGYVKNAHPQYENAVDADLVSYFASKPNIHIVSAQTAARPGWLCTPLV